MTWREALDRLADHPAIDGYRRLCADDWHDVPARDAYRRKVLRLAGEPEPKPEPPRPSAQQTTTILKQMHDCPHRTKQTGCGCGGLATCTLGKGRGGLVNHHDCIACLKAQS